MKKNPPGAAGDSLDNYIDKVENLTAPPAAEPGAAAAPGAAAEPGATSSPGEPGAAPADDPGANEEALMYSRIAVDLLADQAALEFPVLSFDPEMRARAASKIAPVLIKHRVLDRVLNGWLKNYRVEFECGAFFAGVIWESYRKIQGAKAERAPAPADPAHQAAPAQ